LTIGLGRKEQNDEGNRYSHFEDHRLFPQGVIAELGREDHQRHQKPLKRSEGVVVGGEWRGAPIREHEGNLCAGVQLFANQNIFFCHGSNWKGRLDSLMCRSVIVLIGQECCLGARICVRGKVERGS
jgi:hypothetical protein